MQVSLLHIPKFSSVYLPLGEFINITYMPMGLPAIAVELQRAGYETSILHFAVEWLADPAHSMIDEIIASDASLMGADLYWHYQTYDVLDVLTRIHEQRPELFLFLGGTTAGYFAESILREFPAVRAVVKGDGEIAAVALADAIRDGTSLHEVPNLVWRDESGAIHHNARRIFSTQDTLDSLVFGDLSLLRNHQLYVQNFGFPLAFPKGFSAERNQRTQRMGNRSFFPLCTGRGCPWECTFCGGNRKTLHEITGKPTLRFRNPEAVLDDMERAVDFGYKTMSLCFDPTPERDDYYIGLMEEIQRRKLDIDWYFECWGLPTRRFANTWVATFGADNPHSYLALSPDAGNEEVRKLNKQPYYSNEQFFACMDILQETGISADIFFTIALPGENLVRALETSSMIAKIKNEYTVYKRVMTWSVQLEPGSPQFERPAAYGMQTDRKNLHDFYRVHGGMQSDTYSALGFKIDKYFGDARDQGSIADFEADIQHLKCMEFCFFGEDATLAAPAKQGRQWCLDRRNEIAAAAGLDAQPLIDTSVRYSDAALALAPAFPKTRPRWQ